MKKFIALTLMLCGSVAFASSSLPLAKLTSTSEIGSPYNVEVADGLKFIMNLASTARINPKGCSDTSRYEYTDESGKPHPFTHSAYQLVMRAYAEKKSIDITVSDKVCSQNNHPAVISVRTYRG